jgi:very-short-patch-repair endonuclease
VGVLRAKVDAVIAELAVRQHGAVTRAQLRIRSGLLVPVHHGVYLVGLGPVPLLAHEAAAVLACGPHAMLSHRTAGPLWELPVKKPDEIELTVVGRHRKSPAGLHVHSIASLAPSELRRHDGVPITSPSLTVLDLAGLSSEKVLRAVVNEARVLKLVTDEELRATLRRHPRRAGARALRKLLDSELGLRITRSEAERKALEVMREHGIEPDASDFAIGPYRADFWFERERVVVEVDGYRYHGTPKRFVDDRRRSNYLASKGIQVFPLTWHDLGPGAARAMTLLSETLAERRRLLLPTENLPPYPRQG